MDKIFIEARSKIRVSLPEKLINHLCSRVIVFTTVQYLDSLKDIEVSLQSAGKEPILKRVGHASYPGQVLGCSIQKIHDAGCILYVGEGRFHPLALKLENDIPVYTYDPVTKKSGEISKDDIKPLKQKQKAGLVAFHSSEHIGVLVTIKPGQERFKDALKLEKKYPGKRFYFLIDDTFDFAGLADFNFINCFVNTACPRIGLDDSVRLHKPVINIDELI